MNPPVVVVALAAFMLSAFPPDWAESASWLSVALVCGANLWLPQGKAYGRRRPYGAILGLALLGPPLLELGFGNFAALGTLPYALTALACFCAAEGHLASPAGKRAWITAFAAVIWIQVIFASTQWRLSVPGAAATSTALWLRLFQHRVWGTFLTSNILAAWLILVLPAMAGYIFQLSSWRSRFFPSASFLAGAILLWFTRSGGAFASLIAALGVLLLLTGPKKVFRLIFLTTLLTAGLLGLLLWLRGFTFGNASSDQDVIFSRLEIWRPAWHAWLEAPWLGRPGMAEGAYIKAQPLYHGFGAYPHQALLSFLMNWGILGLLIMAVAFALFWARFRRRLDFGLSRVELGLVTGLSAVFFHSQIEMSFQQPAVFLSALMALGALLGSSERQ